MYDNENVFAKIIKGELTSKKIYEDDHVLCFEDIAKSAPTHWLVIPKGKYTDFSDFTTHASAKEVAHFFQTIAKILNKHGLDKTGYKLLMNTGKDSGQLVFHFHVHILSNKNT
ncbi:MAG: HIT domain-containing protein [Rickettsiales bacterium]|nr:HIT domain-containing protein [Rickettsiales bacterium]